MADLINEDLWKIIISALLFIVFISLGNLIYLVSRRVLDERINVRNSKMVSRVAEYLTFALGLYIIYSYIGLDIKTYAASLGIISIAVAFSSQQIIQNLVAGIIISLERPVQIEDWVDVGAGISQTGLSRVKDITLMRTVLRDKEGRVIYLPNSMLMTSRIFNYTKSGFIEVPINVKVGLNTDLERIKKTLLEAAKEDPEVLPEVAEKNRKEILSLLHIPRIQHLLGSGGRKDLSMFEPKIITSEISENTVTLSLRVWIRDVNKREEIISNILSAFINKIKNEGINLK